MVHMDIFNNDAFSLIEMTEAVNKIPFAPGYLGSLGIFTSRGVTQNVVSIEEKSGVLNLIQTTPRGTPPKSRTGTKRKMRNFNIPRLAEFDQLFAAEIQGIRAFGTESELETVVQKVNEKQMDLLADLQLTLEYHRLGALQGILLDADGSVLYNFFDEFGIAQPAEIDFNLDAASPTKGVLTTLIADSVKRPIIRALGGVAVPGMRIKALCGDAFWDAFKVHNDVQRTFENWEAAAALREAPVFEEFSFGGVDWVNYRGTDDNSTVSVGTDKVKFFVTGVPGLFGRFNGPGETFETVNTIGKELYSMLIRDKDRDMWVQPEVYAYPLHICRRPEILLRGRRT